MSAGPPLVAGGGSSGLVLKPGRGWGGQLRIVAQAQDIVAAAEHTDLTHALTAVRQRLADAQRRLTQERADADAGVDAGLIRGSRRPSPVPPRAPSPTPSPGHRCGRYAVGFPVGTRGYSGKRRCMQPSGNTEDGGGGGQVGGGPRHNTGRPHRGIGLQTPVTDSATTVTTRLLPAASNALTSAAGSSTSTAARPDARTDVARSWAWTLHTSDRATPHGACPPGGKAAASGSRGAATSNPSSGTLHAASVEYLHPKRP